jgi:hypothetical protein
MAKSIIPIGKPLGWMFDDSGLQGYDWFRGDDIIELTANEAATLLATLSHYEEHAELRFDRSTYFRFLKENSDTLTDQELGSLIDGLLGKGLLAEVDMESGGIESFLRSYRMMPVGRSWGNTKEDPDRFGIGPADLRALPGGQQEPVMFVNGWVHTIWAISHADGSIWRGCELQAEHAGDCSAMDVARAVVPSIPMIVAAEFGHLEQI